MVVRVLASQARGVVPATAREVTSGRQWADSAVPSARLFWSRHMEIRHLGNGGRRRIRVARKSSVTRHHRSQIIESRSHNLTMRGPSPLLRTARTLRLQRPTSFVCWQCRTIQISAVPSSNAPKAGVGGAFGAPIDGTRDMAGMEETSVYE